MAKKTNKTEHVLSLLSGTDAAVEKDEKKETEKKGTGQEKDKAVQENPAVNRRGNAVSYTHLDVYKRQDYSACQHEYTGTAGIFHIPFPVVDNDLVPAGHQCFFYKKYSHEPGAGRPGPVSYTHLRRRAERKRRMRRKAGEPCLTWNISVRSSRPKIC